MFEFEYPILSELSKEGWCAYLCDEGLSPELWLVSRQWLGSSYGHGTILPPRGERAAIQQVFFSAKGSKVTDISHHELICTEIYKRHEIRKWPTPYYRVFLGIPKILRPSTYEEYQAAQLGTYADADAGQRGEVLCFDAREVEGSLPEVIQRKIRGMADDSQGASDFAVYIRDFPRAPALKTEKAPKKRK